ncbi:MAG: caspase family protein [Planctomycetota bacterium]
MPQDRAISYGIKTPALIKKDFACSRAYVIGINEYSTGIPKLRTAVADAAKLGQLLADSHGYQVQSYPRDGSPTLANLRDLLQRMQQEVGPNDRVLFYFAGHGIALDGEDGPEGYLVPEDANREERTSFLSMVELNEAISKLPCRHFLLILDCCFAGAFRWSSTRDLSPLPSVIHRERFERYIQDPAWQVLTSAAYNQKALDVLSGSTIGQRVETGRHSPFAEALFRALEGEADLIPRGKDGQPGGDGVITATELYLYLRESVETATVEQRMRQTPGLWPLKKHDKGEYILLAPGQELNLPPAPELNYSNNPYRGLQSFDEEHSRHFFGREGEIEELHKLVSSQSLTVVLGASGTGKSSLVKAGLLPSLRSSATEKWLVLPAIRVGSSPLATLASLLPPDGVSAIKSDGLLDDFRTNENALANRVKKWEEANPDASHLLLTVDQFEELITLCKDTKEKDLFIAQLANAILSSPDRFRLVLTLRTDFEPQFLDCSLKTYWMNGRYIVPPMSTDDLRRAIEGPASARVLYLKPQGLIDLLVDEVIQTPGALPLLSFTMSELYVRYIERQGDDRCLTLADYQELGGVAGALRCRASKLHEGLDRKSQMTLKRLMLRMVSADGGNAARRRVPKSELEYASKDENVRVATVLQLLSDARLVVEGKESDDAPYVEPAHDELILGWDKLHLWRRNEQEQFTLRQLLTPAANDWHVRQGGTWYANPRLSLLRRIMDSEDNWLNSTESCFVDRSAAVRTRIIVGALSIVAVAFVILSIITCAAVAQRNLAINRQHELNIANEDLRDSSANTETVIGLRNESEGDLTTAIHRYARAVDISRLGQRENLINRQRLGLLLSRQPKQLLSLTLANDVRKLSFSPDGKFLAIILGSSEENQTPPEVRLVVLRLHDLLEILSQPLGTNSRSRTVLWLPSNNGILATTDDSISIWAIPSGFKVGDISGIYDNASISPDGRRVVAKEFASDQATIWDLLTGEKLAILAGHRGNIHAMTFSPDGSRILTASQDMSYREWDGVDGELLRLLSDHDDYLSNFFFSGTVLSDAFWPHANYSPDGSKIITGGNRAEDSSSNFATVYSATNGERLGRLSGHSRGPTFNATYSPDGSRILTLGINGEPPKIWSAGEPRVFPDDIRLQNVGFSPDGEQIITISPDNVVRLWNAFSGQLSATVVPHTDRTNAIEFHPSSKVLATAGGKTLKLWLLQPGRTLRRMNSQKAIVSDVDQDTAKERIVTAAWDSNARIWDLRDETKRIDLQSPYKVGLSQCRFSPNGKLVATADGQGHVFIWNEKGNLEKEWKVHDNVIPQIEFSPDGELLAVATFGRSLKVFETKTFTERCEIRASEQSWDNNPMFAMPTGGVPIYRHVDYRNALFPGQSIMPFKFAFSRSGNHLLTAFNDTVVEVWGVKDGERVGTLKGHSLHINDLSFAPALDIVATVSDDMLVKLWKVPSGNEVKSLSGHENRILRVAWSPVGNALATSSLDGKVILWDTEVYEKKFVLSGHTSPVWELTFSPDGSTLGSGALDGTALLWDTQTGRRIGRFTYHHNCVTHLRFFPSRDAVFTVARDFSAPTLWDVSPIRQGAPFVSWVEDLTSSRLSNAGVAEARDKDVAMKHLWEEFFVGNLTPSATVATGNSIELCSNFHNAFKGLREKEFELVKTSVNAAESHIKELKLDPSSDPMCQEAIATALRIKAILEAELGDPESAARLAVRAADAYRRLDAGSLVSTNSRREIEMLALACKLPTRVTERAQFKAALAMTLAERSPLFDELGFFISGRSDSWLAIADACLIQGQRADALIAFQNAAGLCRTAFEKYPSNENLDRMINITMTMVRAIGYGNENVFPFEDYALYLASLQTKFPQGRFEIFGAYNAACIYALGYGTSRNEKLAQLAVALLKNVESNGFNDKMQLATDPDLESIRGKSEFDSLLERMSRPYSPIGLNVDMNRMGDQVLVRDVFEHSPASRAGIQLMDAIVSVDGVFVRNVEGWSKLIQFKRLGDRVVVTVQREGESLDLVVDLVP